MRAISWRSCVFWKAYVVELRGSIAKHFMCWLQFKRSDELYTNIKKLGKFLRVNFRESTIFHSD